MDQYRDPRSPRFQGPRADTRDSFRVNLPDLEASQALPQLNIPGFAAEAGAGAAIGRGMEGLGEGGARIAQEIYESANRQKVDEAGAKLAAASQDISREIAAEPDQSKWVGIFETHAAKWEQDLLKDQTLSPAARDAIESRISEWKIRGSSSTLRAAFDARIRKEAEGLEGGRIMALNAGNYEEAERLTQEQERRGLIAEDTAARQRVQAANARREAEEKAAFDLQYDAIKRDPRAWLSVNKERPEDMKAATFERLVNLAQQTDHEQSAADAEAFINDMVSSRESGVPYTPAVADEWRKGDPRITPAMREEMRAHIIRMNDAAAKASIAANAPEIASQLRTEVANFDWQKDGELEYYKLRMRINELPAPIQGEVSRGLEMKFPGRAGELDAPKEVKDLVEDTLTSMFNAGQFGQFDHGTGKNAKGEPVDAPGQSPDEEYKRSPLDYQRALRAKAIIGGKMRRWLDANPKATPEDAQKKLYEFVPDATRASLLDLFDPSPRSVPSPAQANTPPPRESPEGLPDNPGPADNTLLPFSYNP